MDLFLRQGRQASPRILVPGNIPHDHPNSPLLLLRQDNIRSPTPPASPHAAVLQDTWQLEGHLSDGAYGAVYKLTHVRSRSKKAVAKFATPSSDRQLHNEAKVYARLTNGMRRPAPFGFANPLHFSIRARLSGARIASEAALAGRPVLVVEQLGRNLQTIVAERTLSPGASLAAGRQVLARLKRLHNSGFLHHDVKPGNLVLGMGSRSHSLHLIDFGLAAKLNSSGYFANETRSHLGTPRFASYNALKGAPTSCRDDLMSLVYCIVYCARSSLPWSASSSRSAIAAKKARYPLSQLCRGFPEAFYHFARNIRDLRRGQTPDYAKLSHYLMHGIRKAGGPGGFKIET